MPDTSLSAAIQEALTICPRSVREIQTIEVVQPGNPYVTATLELCLCVDTTGSMGGLLDTLVTCVRKVVNDLQEDFIKVSVAVVEFKGTDADDDGHDEDGPPEILTGNRFRDVEVAIGELDGLVADGGGDTPEDGYGAICVACAGLPWTAAEGNARAVFLLTDAPSHERTNTLEDASAALLEKDIKFFYGPYSDGGTDGYDSLVLATSGAYIDSSSFDTPAALRATLTAVLRELSVDDGLESIFLVNDNVPLHAQLETGEWVDFGPRGFGINTSSSGEDGVKGINLTIDNYDLQVSKYLAQAAKRTAPVEIRYRVYHSNDLTGPQNNPPITLYLGPVEISGNKVSGEARWIDIQNSSFPNLYYDRAHFPGL